MFLECKFNGCGCPSGGITSKDTHPVQVVAHLLSTGIASKVRLYPVANASCFFTLPLDPNTGPKANHALMSLMGAQLILKSTSNSVLIEIQTQGLRHTCAYQLDQSLPNSELMGTQTQDPRHSCTHQLANLAT
eukprot:1157784-Pelagomonas_calceolata.AAC.3